MKRILSMALAFMLFAIPACSEGIDLSGMSIEELTALNANVLNELTARMSSSLVRIEMPMGKYICGTHIDPGNYVLRCVTTMKDDECASIYIYENEDASASYSSLNSYALGRNESVYIELKQGFVISLFDGSFTIEAADLKFPQNE